MKGLEWNLITVVIVTIIVILIVIALFGNIAPEAGKGANFISSNFVDWIVAHLPFASGG